MDAAPKPAQGAVSRLLDALTSVWLGVALMFLLFVYMSVGSAGYAIRQSRWFEMTEYEWFHWWPFDALIALLCINLTIATIRRIPLRLVNLGVWMIHAGIVVLCVGSVIYFSQKVEGDTPVFRRSVVIESDNHAPLNLVAIPGAHAAAGEGDGERFYEVTSTDPSWPILSEPDAGARAYAVTVRVSKPDGTWYQRQLLDGYPQYTEDILPTGRAIKSTGERIADRETRMTLAPWTQSRFYLAHTWALYFREVTDSGFTEWSQRPLRAMPRYNDYIPTREDAFLDAYESERRTRIDPSPLNIRAARTDNADPVPQDVDVRVTGYLRYAVMNARFEQAPDTAPLQPVADVTLNMVGQPPVRRQLTATRARAVGESLPLRWVDSQSEVADVARSAPALLRFTWPDGASAEIPATPAPAGDEATTPLLTADGKPTGWSVRVRETINDVPMNEETTISIAVIDLTSADKTITRWVADNPAYTRDFRMSSAEKGDLQPPDAAITATFQPGRRPVPITLVAAPRDGRPDLALFAVVAVGGEPTVREVNVGQSMDLGPMASIVVNSFWPRSQRVIKPAIVPVSQRDRDAEAFYAMVKVELAHHGHAHAQWVPYHQYVFDHESYTYGQRFRFQPARFTLDDGRTIEVMLSRRREDLPSPVSLEDFRLITHVGGFSGDVSSIRDWESIIRFDQQPPEQTLSVRTNAPASFKGLRFFQAMWDPPQRATQSAGVTSPGLNFTGLGVGSRTGVITQLLGCILSTIGMLYAFYIKPIIKRRKQEAVLAGVRAGEFGADAAARLARKQSTPEPALASAAGTENTR